ncbi:MAG TPA: cell division protein FtsZ [Kiritimatiellia bacterium]|nr:cell division protein FtsZ [Kiritimatiellia bacterium]
MPPRPNGQLFPPPDLKPRSRVLVMGVGGAGCNGVARMTSVWSEGPPVVAVNTDAQALAACGVSRTVLIGEKATRGLGAAGDVTAGRLAAEESLSVLQDLAAGCDLLILVAGLGRGTGTGALPVIAKIARELGILTLCFVAMPFGIEGDRTRRVAEEGLRQLRRHAGAVIALPNDRLLKLADESASLDAAFGVSDGMLAEGVHAIWYLLSHTGVINITFADLQELAERSGGSLSFAHAEAAGPARVASALRALLDSPLLERGRLLSEAQGVLVNIAGGPDLTLADLQGIMGQITSSVRANAHVSMGALVDPARRERVTITLLAAESWQEERQQQPAAATDPGDRAEKPRAGDTQPELGLGELKPQDRGAFGKSSPTLINGEDLDIPTYIRRGIKLSFER